LVDGTGNRTRVYHFSGRRFIVSNYLSNNLINQTLLHLDHKQKNHYALQKARDNGVGVDGRKRLQAVSMEIIVTYCVSFFSQNYLKFIFIFYRGLRRTSYYKIAAGPVKSKAFRLDVEAHLIGDIKRQV